MNAAAAAPRRTVSMAYAGLYVFFLAWIILFKLTWPQLGGGELRSIKLLPFASDGTYAGSGVKEVLVNFLLFVPVGMNLRLLWPKLGLPGALAAGLALSLLLEILQFALAVGSSDATDLITNTAGCLAGFAAARFVPSLRRVCAVISILTAVLAVLFIASPIRFATIG